MPRTTVDIQASVLKELKRLQETEKKSLGSLVSELLAEALALRSRSGERRELRWHVQPMGARLDLNDKDALWAVLDKPE